MRLQRSLAVFAPILAITGGFALTGCTKTKTETPPEPAPVFEPAPQPPAPLPAPPDSPAPEVDTSWSLRISSSCGATEARECRGGYGLTVQNDGRYLIGPGPAGETRRGKLTAEEFKKLGTAVSDMELTHPTNPFGPGIASTETCIQHEPEPMDDAVAIIRKAGEKTLARVTTDLTCYSLNSAEPAQALHKMLRELLERYYQGPFPDACLDNANQIELQYEDLGSCNVDADCAYLDYEYVPIREDEIQFVYTDACTVLRPLAVASRAAAAAAASSLVDARDKLRLTCGDRISRDDCAGIDGFQAQEAPPVCVNSTCRINPVLGIVR